MRHNEADQHEAKKAAHDDVWQQCQMYQDQRNWRYLEVVEGG